MKTFFSILLACLTITLYAQQPTIDVERFTKIIASPHIHVILEKGDRESVRITHNGDISDDKINVVVNGKTLAIFLDGARKIEKTRKHHYGIRKGIYDGVSVTAHITYRDLEAVEIRGNQELTCNSPIESDEFRLRAYGENDITLASLQTEYFKTSLYGENKLKINSGRVIEQKYRLFGENKVDTRPMKSAYATTNVYGEGRVRLSSSEEVRVNTFGESQILVDGGAHINRRLVFGEANIQQVR